MLIETQLGVLRDTFNIYMPKHHFQFCGKEAFLTKV